MGRFLIMENASSYVSVDFCVSDALDTIMESYPRTSATVSISAANRFTEKCKDYGDMLGDMASGKIKGSRQIYDHRYGLDLTVEYVPTDTQSTCQYEVTRDGVSIFIGKKSLALTHLQLDMLHKVGYNKKQQVFILDQLFNDLEAEVSSTTHEGTVKWLMKKID